MIYTLGDQDGSVISQSMKREVNNHVFVASSESLAVAYFEQLYKRVNAKIIRVQSLAVEAVIQVWK